MRYFVGMKINTANIKTGMRLIYNDGRAGHTSAECRVMAMTAGFIINPLILTTTILTTEIL